MNFYSFPCKMIMASSACCCSIRAGGAFQSISSVLLQPSIISRWHSLSAAKLRARRIKKALHRSLRRANENDRVVDDLSGFLDDDGTVKDMEKYLDHLSLEYDSVWDTKPAWGWPGLSMTASVLVFWMRLSVVEGYIFGIGKLRNIKTFNSNFEESLSYFVNGLALLDFSWCQPWTICLTGVMAITGSWSIFHSMILTFIVLTLVGAWWYNFLYSYPQNDLSMPAARYSRIWETYIERANVRFTPSLSSTDLIFSYNASQAYLEMINERRRRVKNGLEDTFGNRKQ